jgi:hypothetical protein
LVEHACYALHMVWRLEPESQVQYATFNFHTRLYMLHETNSTIGVMYMVTKDDYAFLVQFAK